VKLAAADRFYIRQRGPDKVFDTNFLSGANRSSCLLEFVRTWFPKTGGQEDAVRTCEGSFKRFGAV